MLYGWSGYLYCLLAVVQATQNQTMKELVHEIIKKIVRFGREISGHRSRIKIKWPFDRDDNKLYLGGAHGLIGTLQMILQAFLILPELKSDEKLVKTIEKSCESVLS